MLKKRILDISLSLLLLVLSVPLIVLIAVLIKLFSEGPVLFRQKRTGIMWKEFTIYKFRTMAIGSEKKQKQLKGRNEADGPVFKIYNDPRFTKIGKVLAHTGLDELPQLINVIKGEMSLVGPRPLPISEATKIPDKYHARFSVLPGITSSWVIKGSHDLSFNEWMKLDVDYVKNKNFIMDLKITLLTIWFIAISVFRIIFKTL